MIRIQLGNSTPKSDAPSHHVSRTIKATKFETRDIVLTLKSTEKQGREAWTYLHTTDDPLNVIVAKFETLIPRYGCSCKRDYAELKKQHPFDYTSADAFFVSTIRLHNAVNRKIGKPEITIAEARKIWNRPQPTE